MDPARREQMVERLRDFFAADLTKVALSALILVSLVLPAGVVDHFGVLFFVLFSLEVCLRVLVLRQDRRRGQLSRLELVFLGLDILATLSFLPIHLVWNDARLLRLFRLSRMLLLLDYWGPVVREMWFILGKRERRYQLSFVLITVVILTVSSALILDYFQVQGVDFNGDGIAGNDHSFPAMLWWSFLQLESADNLLRDANASLAFMFSLLLTLSGLFLFSFLIGIGNSVVEELVELSKQRRLGMHRHTVIANVGPYSAPLLHELAAYYAKSLRSPRIAVLGPSERRYDYMLARRLMRIRYRQGQPLARHDLHKVDADRATRIILLGQTAEANSDSEIVSQLLSVREVNPRCPIYAELRRADSVPAALQAGGPNTVPVLANRLVGLYLANLMVFPGVEELFRELLSSSGDEIYTCLYEQGAMAGHAAPAGPARPFPELLEHCHREHGVLMLGHLHDDPSRPDGTAPGFLPGVAPAGGARPAPSEPGRLRGYFGIAANFERLRACVAALPSGSPLPLAAPAPVPLFSACAGASTLRSLLIGGFHEGMVDFCEELILFSELAEIFVVVPTPGEAAGVAEAFLHRTHPALSGSLRGGRVTFQRRGELELGFARGEGPVAGRLHIAHGDWSDGFTLRGGQPDGHRLDALDAALLTYQPGESDPDARTSLAALKLIQLRDQGGALKPSFRLFCEFQHGEKAALFQRRFVHTGGSTCGQVTVLAAEGMRDAFLAQAVFVPGIVSVYSELLGKDGVHLRKLLPESPAEPGHDLDFADLDFGHLLATVCRRDGVLVVAVELADARGRRVVVNPQPGSRDYRFPARALTAIFAIGELDKFPRSQASPAARPEPTARHRACPGCFLAGGAA